MFDVVIPLIFGGIFNQFKVYGFDLQTEQNKMKRPKIKLSLNKETIARLDAIQLNNLRGGEGTVGENGVETFYDDPNGDPDGKLAFLSLWGSNCYDTDPLRHNCCVDKGETIKPDTSFHPCTDR